MVLFADCANRPGSIRHGSGHVLVSLQRGPFATTDAIIPGGSSSAFDLALHRIAQQVAHHRQPGRLVGLLRIDQPTLRLSTTGHRHGSITQTCWVAQTTGPSVVGLQRRWQQAQTMLLTAIHL